jgi:glycerol-3-phosphate acyltransferase PlsY
MYDSKMFAIVDKYSSESPLFLKASPSRTDWLSREQGDVFHVRRDSIGATNGLRVSNDQLQLSISLSSMDITSDQKMK